MRLVIQFVFNFNLFFSSGPGEFLTCLEHSDLISLLGYFQNEHQKTDGGLGAGTPMFINEVMHGAACNIL